MALMNPESRVSEPAWGTWDDAERWRREDFQRRSPATRLAWLEDVWLLGRTARTQREARERQASTSTQPPGPIAEDSGDQ